MRPDPPPSADSIDHRARLRYEEGQEHAPDDPWGLESVELVDDGTFTYQRRRAGQLISTHVGAIGADRARTIFADLARSSYPEVPPHQSPPGPSMVSISMSPGPAAALYRNFGLKLEGYREVIAALTGVVARVREDADSVVQGKDRDESIQ